MIFEGVKRYLRRNTASNQLSFLYGPTTRNQRIEAWWYFFLKSGGVWWINVFKDMCEEGIFDASIEYHQECLRLCFMGILQIELDETKLLWNTYYIRRVRNSECAGGRPDVLYFTPQLVATSYPIAILT